ncbi:MAG TPA: Crp/Fnr family transcriptional regulator [Vicinamibacterales bacterium]|nr:Crp/Fnr family transcriptional regulator [Vicinamibacterales bacterium]
MESKPPRQFNAQAFLNSAGIAPKGVAYPRGAPIFVQGDACTSVMYIQKGSIKLSVSSNTGREAIVAVLGPGEFFGEGCLAGQPARMGNATAQVASRILVIKKEKMLRLLHEQPALADRFITHMLGTNIRIEEDLLDQLFNHHEKRLARALLLLARYGMKAEPERLLPKISRQKLASLAGITRSNVDFFMKKFERLGFIADDGELTVNNSLLSVVLHE